MVGRGVIKTLRLLLPALIPSWNFFDVIAASPRVEYRLGETVDAASGAWGPFRPRHQRVSAATMLRRLFWNARWNETLFVVSCAERLLADPTAHSETEIFRRIAADLVGADGWLSFRIVLVGADEREVAYVSASRRLADIDVR